MKTHLSPLFAKILRNPTARDKIYSQLVLGTQESIVVKVEEKEYEIKNIPML
jgi:hypothetical protein